MRGSMGAGSQVVLAACGFALAVGTSAQACQVPEGATNPVRLVSEADTIVRAVVLGSGRAEGTIKFRVLETLKGNAPSSPLVVLGRLEAYEGSNDRPVPYGFVRPGGRHGNCFASDYAVGKQFLLLLRRGDVHWAPLGATNEEVSGPNDPWVRWVAGQLRLRR